MTIAISIAILAASFGYAWLLSRGLPETMRAAALWLLVNARELDERRRERDAVTRQGLSAEAR